MIRVKTPDGIDEELLRPRTRQVLLELTKRCNLRCDYCATSQPDYVGLDLELDVESLIPSLERLRPREVQVSGHGETTVLSGWSAFVDRLVDRGCPVSLASNFAREFSGEEIAALARLERLTVSCDTADPELFRDLRKGGRLEQLELNFRRLRALFTDPGPRPHIAINCVVSKRTIYGLPGLVDWAADQGADCIAFIQLIPNSAAGGMEDLALEGLSDTEVGTRLAAARDRARARGLDVHFLGAHLERVVEAAS